MKDRKKERKIRPFFIKIASSMLAISLLALSVFAFYGIVIPKNISCFSYQDVPSYLGTTFDGEISESDTSVINVFQGQYKLFGAIPVKNVTVAKIEDVKVYVGGAPFGIKFLTKGVSVVGFENEETNPAYRAGLRLYDTVVKINGVEIGSSGDLLSAINGSEIQLTILRAGKEMTIKFKPEYSESEKRYTLGLWLKDSGAGIGTLTYVLADGTFGGLGHGICESDTGELTQITSGSVLGVTLNGIVKGKKGIPGELKGYFNSSKIGAIYKNTEVGVFGTLAQIPDSIKGKTYSIGLKNDLKEGKATVICTLDDNTRQEYSIEISNINRNADGNKCFTIKITDERLIKATGGIVQGMSGSPIIQNGKLVGAVTHVLINDPTAGYGIFIENMLTQSASATEHLPTAA